jgi:hypothetical protein
MRRILMRTCVNGVTEVICNDMNNIASKIFRCVVKKRCPCYHERKSRSPSKYDAQMFNSATFKVLIILLAVKTKMLVVLYCCIVFCAQTFGRFNATSHTKGSSCDVVAPEEAVVFLTAPALMPYGPATLGGGTYGRSTRHKRT